MPAFIHKYLLIPCLLGSLAITACKSSSDEDSDENVDVGKPAKEILNSEGSLHTFAVHSFIRDPDEIDNDVMVLSFDNFAPSVTDIEPKEDEDQTLNDLKYSRSNWKEESISWSSNNDPLLELQYNQPRPYRVLKNNTLLPSPNGVLNKPVYETIKDNIFERQLGASFVWDFGRYGDVRTDRDVSGERLDRYEELYGFTILPYVTTWADIRSQARPLFSEGAVIYAASRSVAYDEVVVESVKLDNAYSLSPTRFGTGVSDLTTLVSLYPLGGTRLAYQFTIDYTKDYTLYISFDTISGTAHLFDMASGGTVIAEPSFTVHSDKPYVEINTEALSSGERKLLNLPSYFNPVIIGPIDGDYYYGKRYIKTQEFNRLLLEPIFFFNPKAKQDIEATFKAWRQQEHLDND